MLILRSHITIYKDDVKKFYFNKVQSCNIKSSWDTMTDTAEIVLPNYFIKSNRFNFIKSNIVRGQKIEIELGYASKLVLCFTGYIKKITTDSPFTIFAEDYAYVLKQKTITSWSKKVNTVKTLLTDLKAELNISFPMNILSTKIDMNVGAFEVRDETIIAVLDRLKSKNLSLLSFFRNGELFVGSPSFLAAEFPSKYGGNEYNFWFDGELVNIKYNNLIWNDETDIRQVIKGVIIKTDNSSTIVFAYYHNSVPTITTTQPDGNMITHFEYNISQTDMNKMLLEELQQINYTGWHGNFTTFGDKIYDGIGEAVEHGDKVYLRSYKEPEKSGKYLVKEVEINFGVDGYERIITLDRKLTI